MKPIVVMIRDGWGYRSQEEYNGPFKGYTPFTDHLMVTYPNVLIEASGTHVGLPNGFIGNSEVGHMTIGSGRINNQSLVRINKSIEDGSFFHNEKFLEALDNCKQKNSTLHLMGLLQSEGVHSDINHLFALLDLCKQHDFTRVVVHVFTDGRDSPVDEAKHKMQQLLDKLNELGFGSIGSISGRYYAMDRDRRWDRTKRAYDVIVNAQSERSFSEPLTFLNDCYAKEETDEFIIPTKYESYCGVKDDDVMIFFNFRTDRPRQLTQAIIEEDFEGWVTQPLNVHYVAMTDYYTPMNPRATVAFDKLEINNTLGEVLSRSGKKQLRISETEKYAHVTFFFNGQIETPFENEDRILIHSPKVATYDLQPEMSVHEIGDTLLQKLDEDIYDVIIVNYVNGDMVGHTGDWEAVLKAVTAVDQNVEKVVNKVLDKDGICLVFADHGNCEEMEGKYQTSHTTNPVPFIAVSNQEFLLKEGKALRDIAPTVLKLLGIEKPSEMTGESIIN